jgi:hypothetical protein
VIVAIPLRAELVPSAHPTSSRGSKPWQSLGASHLLARDACEVDPDPDESELLLQPVMATIETMAVANAPRRFFMFAA